MRKIFRREGPVAHEGREISLPYSGPGSSGLGKPLKSILHMNPNIPIMLGAENEAVVKLCGELCDGLLPLGLVPGTFAKYKAWLEAGFKRAGGGKSLDKFEIFPIVPVVIATSRRRWAMKPISRSHAGGLMRAAEVHNELMARRDFPGGGASRIISRTEGRSGGGGA
jgi:alkanesulfonate monooxygenase SsuD/methylene tetrahydromethanopterin reductase-like flavin-dependent oxidoreductase (luciferase family)